MKQEEIIKARQKLEVAIQQIVKSVPKLLEPLKKLTAEQRDAVTILSMLMDVMQLLKRPQFKFAANLLQNFSQEVNNICPPIGKVIVSKDPCFDASVAYISALKKCEDEGKTEAECPDAWGPGGQSVQCVEDKIADMKKDIVEIFKHQDPPKPDPWPDDPF